jgi:ribonuclease P/MRP protein subunit RPP1
MSKALGLTQLTLPLSFEQPSLFETEVALVSRITLLSGKLNVLKNKIGRVRKQAVVVAVPVGGVTITNWAAEDERVDLLTLTDPSRENSLRTTTAGLAVDSGTALEIPIRPLLRTSGLTRSKTLKVYREACRTATDAGMSVVISSGATEPIQLRSPRALRCIAHLLGMEDGLAKSAVIETPERIVATNLKRLRAEFVAPGIEVVERGDES